MANEGDVCPWNSRGMSSVDRCGLTSMFCTEKNALYQLVQIRSP